ncbi:hypothetical protein M378DRAFT_32061, partial [Amanita muscaria Koide BX008]
MADALSRIYSDEPMDVVWVESEFVGKDNDVDEEDREDNLPETSRPVYTGAVAAVLDTEEDTPLRRSTRLAEAGAEKRTYVEPKRTYKKK